MVYCAIYYILSIQLSVYKVLTKILGNNVYALILITILVLCVCLIYDNFLGFCQAYNKIVEDITFHEMTILQTLGKPHITHNTLVTLIPFLIGFDVQVKHPHPHVVECMNLVGGN